MTELAFSSLHGAAILFEHGAVLRLNDRMKQVYPDLKAGDPVPQELLHAQEPEVAGAVVPIGRTWLALVTPVACREGAALHVQLDPLRPEVSANVHLEVAVRNFLQQLSAGKDAVIERGILEENPEVEQYFSGINHQVCRLQKALDECDTRSAGEGGVLLRQAVDFSALFERVCREIEGLQAYLGLGFSWEISRKGGVRPIFVRGDERMLERGLLYLFHQGVELAQKAAAQPEIMLRLTQRKERVQLTLSGSWGVLDRLFRNEQEQLIRAQALHMAQQLICDSGGVLLYAAGKDSTVFHLTLPAAKADAGRIFSPGVVIDRPDDYPASLVVLSDILAQEVYSPQHLD